VATEAGAQEDLSEAIAQLTATSEILAAMGRSASDIDAVLGAVVDSARRLCMADAALIYLLDGDRFRVAAGTGVSEGYREYLAQHPLTADRGTLSGRVVLDRRAHQSPDVLVEPDYGRLDVQRIGGFRTTLGVPMLLDDEVVGVLSLWRSEVRPFSDREVQLVTSFAAQAAVAIRNVDLVRALQSRTSELAVKVDQLEALREIGHVVSSSLDLDEVLATIVSHAVQLTSCDGGSLLELDAGAREFRIRAVYGTGDELLQALRRTSITLDGTLVGRACLLGEPEQVPDLDDAVLDPHLSRLRDAGWRSLLAVPMLHEGGVVGAIVVRRHVPGDFASTTTELLQTFASQSALAIVNARLYSELEAKSAELKVASGHKSEFLASMSHELRTPLNAVIGFSEVLLQRMFGDLNERQDEYLRDILASGRHLLELLNDVLDLSKVEAGKMELEPSRFPVQPALEHGLAMVRERAVDNGVQLELVVEPDVPVVETDELRFRQVVLNLLSNAVKFSHPGGRVRVRAARDEGHLMITVSDEGIGIAPEDQERIFESFQQGGRSRSHAEGTGLGLTLCRRIVGLFGGRMWVQSEPGQGSTFSFTVPLPDPTVIDATTAGDGAPTVVVIEDDRASLELVSLYLDRAGLHVVPARSGEEGLAEVRRHRPEAVVLDIRMPGTDGWQVLEQLKADAVTAAVPVVVATVLDERPRAMALGAAEYLVKPLASDDVLAALRRLGVLGDSRLTSPAAVVTP
jgi:signal transduction histidine kinase/ActR/RegA family two-component response regulator